MPAGKLVDDDAKFAQTCQDSASGVVDACGPRSPDSHRVVWGLTSRPPVSPAGFPPVSRLPTGFFPFARLLWFPFVRRSPVRSLRPLPGSGSPRFPSGIPFPWAIFTLALPGGGSAALVPGGRDQGHRFCRDHPAWIARSACRQMRSGWARWDPVTNRLLRADASAVHRRARTARSAVTYAHVRAVAGAECDLRCVLAGQVLSAGRRAPPVVFCHLPEQGETGLSAAAVRPAGSARGSGSGT